MFLGICNKIIFSINMSLYLKIDRKVFFFFFQSHTYIIFKEYFPHTLMYVHILLNIFIYLYIRYILQ